ncbi:MAG TPA: SRPBCC family protein [Ktedonobacteraceae bacterium]|nr:SRPBCC family protein [Ktedonobacteraceae bacterium]
MITVEVKQTVFIDLPVEAVFAYISDLENLSDWSGVVISARIISPGEMQPGTRVRNTIRFLNRWSDMIFEVIEYESNRVLTLKSINGIARCTIFYQLEPGEGGGTTVFQEAVVHYVEGTVEVAGSVAYNAIRRQFKYDLLTLKDILEAKASMCEIVD